ncbi:MAG: hypothetical protein O3A22_01990 [Bacteroidetes bacterium]|nr:hypothetical protein [Bacteroidota bacterium]
MKGSPTEFKDRDKMDLKGLHQKPEVLSREGESKSKKRLGELLHYYSKKAA